MVKGDVKDALTGSWKIEMLKAPCSAPGRWCYGCCCPCCFAQSQRTELLEITGEPYICCAGLCPCGPCGKPCSSPQPWLCCEACCCTTMAVSGNRFMLQTRFNIANDPCDDRLITCMLCCECLACLARAFVDGDTANAITMIADMVSATVISCMLTQQQVEIINIKEQGTPYQGIPQHIVEALPPSQQEMLGTSTAGAAQAKGKSQGKGQS